MNILGAFKGDYIAAVEFNGRVPTFTIDHVNVVQLEDDKGTVKSKPVVYFRETKRGWVLCKTSALSVAAMFTPETDKWTGKRVTLHSMEVQVGKERKPGIRVVGSPDIPKPITFELKLPRKKAQRVTLKPTATGAIQAPDPDPEPPPENAEPSTGPSDDPIIDPETGEKF